jgi:hypothetical protein
LRLLGAHQADALLEPCLQGCQRHSSDRHDAAFAALAGDTDLAGTQINAGEIEAYELSQTQSGRVEEFHDGAVTRAHRIGGGDLEQVRHLVGIECLGQAAPRLGRAHFVAGVEP